MCQKSHNENPSHPTRNKPRESMRSYHLKHRFGISEADVDAMLEAQGGLCALCREAPAVHVDHDHVTGKVRAILCEPCNGGLGLFKDDPNAIRRAIDYLERAAEKARRESRS